MHTMSLQTDKARTFHALHIPGDPVILFNIWDVGSAIAVKDAGAKAIATGSAPVAFANGYADGEKIPLDFALANARRIAEAVDLPFTLDIEGGYGAAGDVITSTITAAMQAGVIGFNFEDQIVGGEGLYDTQTQTQRIQYVRQAADAVASGAFINARTDIFLKAKPDTHNQTMLNDAIERAKAYEQAGADGFFAPGLADEKLIATLCNEVSLPVNIIALPHVPPKTVLTGAGVARISYGPVGYRHYIKYLSAAAAEAFA